MMMKHKQQTSWRKKSSNFFGGNNFLKLNFYSQRIIITRAVFAAIFISLASVKATEQKKSVIEFKSETNEISNIALPRDKSQAQISLQNTNQGLYLWILARACDKRKKLEHCPGVVLKIEVNGVEIGPDRSVLQELTYKKPLHPVPHSALADNIKYRAACWQQEEDAGWFFKYDVDFVMNNQILNLPRDDWGRRYATAGFNHWYAFNVKGIATAGKNLVTLSVESNAFKGANYDGFLIGTLGFGNLEDMKQYAATYEKQQNFKIAPDEMYSEEKYKEDFNKAYIPEGEVPRFEVSNGYIHRNGKPFFMLYGNPCLPGNRGRESLYQIYNYLNLINVISAGDSFRTYTEITELPIYLKPGWDKYQPQPNQIRELLHESNLIYENKMLAVLYSLSLYYTGEYLEKNHPRLLSQTVDGKLAKGEFSRNFGNFTDPIYQEYLKQTHTMLGRTFRSHPGVWGASLWEELGWRVISQGPKKMIPQSPDDLKRYKEWLKQKYGTVGNLNKEWGTQYNAFSDIKFPEWKEQTGNFVNFQLWRSAAVIKCAEIVYGAFKLAASDQLVLVQKTYGDIGLAAYYWQHDLDNWMYTKYTDVSREYSNSAMAHLGRSSCNEFGKAMEANFCMSEDAYRIWDKPVPWHNLLDQKALNIYPHLMGMLFNGNKALHWEIYDLLYDPRYHFIQYNKRWKQSPQKSIRFEDGGSADVIIPEKTLRISRLHQWAIRNASLVLPAKVVTPQVAVLMSNSSRMIGYDPENKLAKTKKLIQTWVDNPGQDFYLLGNLFDNLHLKFDCIDDRYLDDIFQYKVLIVGYQANVSNQNVADKIKEYVKKGGTVIFYPESTSMRDTDFHYTPESPGFGLSSLCCASINNRKIVEKNGLKVVDAQFSAKPIAFDGKYYGVDLNVKPDGIVLATDSSGKPVLVSDKAGHCYYFGGYLGLTYFQSYPRHEQFAKLIENILFKAGVERPMDLKLADANMERRLMVPGLMEGKGYWLAAVHNFTGKEQSVNLKINGLPNGNYEVTDISGERPVMRKSEDGNFHLKPNFEEAQLKYISGKMDDINVNVPDCYSKVLLIRPAGRPVWINSTAEALRSYVKKGKELKIVIGRHCAPEMKKQAEILLELLSAKGLKASIVNDDEIKTRIVEGRLVEDKYELEKYRHEVLDTDADLVLIGNAEENTATRHLQTAGNYVYCKVPEMVNAGYPGKGRGIIQIAECVNTISYDATDRARDAIMLAGSDQAGTGKAVKSFIALLK